VKVERIASIDEFVSLADEWDDLLEKSGQANVFLTHEWMLSWWKVYGDGGNLFILICRSVENGALVGILPLYRKREGYFPRVNILRFIAGSNVGSDFLEPIFLPNSHQQIFEAFFEFLNKIIYKWDVIEFSSVDVDSIFYHVLNDKKNKFLKFNQYDSQLCPYVNLPESWEEMLTSLSKKVRQKVGYYRRSLDRNSSYEILRVTNETELKDSLDYLMHIRKDRLEAKGIEFDKVSSLYKKFHEKIMKSFLNKGWLNLYFLKLRNKPVAFVYQFVFQGRVFFYQTGFDRTYSAQSVGFVLLGHVIEHVIDEKYKIFEFLRGDEGYKYDWGRINARKISDITICSSSTLSKIYISKNMLKKKLIIRLKNVFKK